MFKRFRKNEKGQGMVEYGLILALVSIISITALGGIGGNIKDEFDRVVSGIGGSVEKTEPTYTEEIQDLIDKEGYIPIATADELNQLRHNAVQTFGGKQYTSGLDKKYIQVANIDLGGIDNFEPIGTKDTANSFTGTYDGGGYTISNLKIDRGSNDFAGLFGRTDGSAELKNIGLVNADVNGEEYVGGLVGAQDGGSGSITNSYASGNVNGGSYVGGLVGYQNRGTITNSYASGSVSGGGSRVGGLVGYQFIGSTITNSHATGEVSGTGNNVGGLVGSQYNSSITNSYATGKVDGVSDVGGLVGLQNRGTITNSYASGSVSGGGDYVGGLVGYQYYGRTTNSYASGSVSGTGDNVGGLAGWQYQYDSTIKNSYWDKDTTGQTTSAGTGATGKTTAEMKTQDTFGDWNFNTIWQIKSGEYPTLQWQK